MVLSSRGARKRNVLLELNARLVGLDPMHSLADGQIGHGPDRRHPATDPPPLVEVDQDVRVRCVVYELVRRYVLDGERGHDALAGEGELHEVQLSAAGTVQAPGGGHEPARGPEASQPLLLLIPMLELVDRVSGGGLRGLGVRRTPPVHRRPKMCTEAELPVAPTLWARARFAFGTCRAPAIPLNCSKISTTWEAPVALTGCPFALSPPEGLTGSFPSRAVSPSAVALPAAPREKNPMSSRATSSAIVKQSCTSMKST